MSTILWLLTLAVYIPLAMLQCFAVVLSRLAGAVYETLDGPVGRIERRLEGFDEGGA